MFSGRAITASIRRASSRPLRIRYSSSALRRRMIGLPSASKSPVSSSTSGWPRNRTPCGQTTPARPGSVVGLQAMQDDVDPSDGVGGPVQLLAVVAELVRVVAVLLQEVGRVD